MVAGIGLGIGLITVIILRLINTLLKPLDLMNVAFHDCVGGCNGCINLSNNSANAGLDDCVSALNTKYDTEVTFQRTNMYYIWYCSLNLNRSR